MLKGIEIKSLRRFVDVRASFSEIMRSAGRIAREEGSWELIKRSWKWGWERGQNMLFSPPVLREIALNLSIHKLKNRIRQERCLDDILDTSA